MYIRLQFGFWIEMRDENVSVTLELTFTAIKPSIESIPDFAFQDGWLRDDIERVCGFLSKGWLPWLCEERRADASWPRMSMMITIIVHV